MDAALKSDDLFGDMGFVAVKMAKAFAELDGASQSAKDNWNTIQKKLSTYEKQIDKKRAHVEGRQSQLPSAMPPTRNMMSWKRKALKVWGMPLFLLIVVGLLLWVGSL